VTSVIKKALLAGDPGVIESMMQNELKLLVKVFPEIQLQADLLNFPQAIQEQGVIKLVTKIKEHYGELAQAEVMLCKDGKTLHLTVGQLVSRLLLAKSPDECKAMFETEACLWALWEKVNTSILSSLALQEQHDYLSVSCLDVINGHYEHLKTALKDKADPCARLAENPKVFRELSANFVSEQPSDTN
jgi:hypothetical protein